MKQTIKQIKVSDIYEIINSLNLSQEEIINITIETVRDDILKVFKEIATEAEEKGLTEEILADLLTDESRT